MNPSQYRPPAFQTTTLRHRWIVLLTLFACLSWHPVWAESFYRYVDDDGVAHFVDEESAIPEKHRPLCKTYTDETEQMTPEQRSAHEARQNAKAQAARAAIETQLENRQQRNDRLAKTPATPMRSSVTIADNQVIVPVTIGYGGRQIETRLLLDTGASVVVLYKSVGDRLGILWPKSIKAQVAGGTEIRAGQTQLTFIKMGGITVDNVVAAIVPEQSDSLSHDGLLGMNVLRHFDYRIDFDENAVEWRPRISSGGRP